MSKIVWAEIPNFSLYEASSDGFVRRHIEKFFSGIGGNRKKPGELLTIVPLSYGYFGYCLKSDENKYTTKPASWFIGRAFLRMIIKEIIK